MCSFRMSKPIFWFGHGVRLAGATHLLEPLLENYPLPALFSWAGADLLDSSHSSYIGRAGTYGQRAANFALEQADNVIAIGTRLSPPMIGYNPTELFRGKKVTVVDIDMLESTKFGGLANSITCDAGDYIRNFSSSLDVSVGWLAYCRALVKRYPWLEESQGTSYRFLRTLEKFLRPDEVIVTDTGTALIGAHQVLRLKPPQRLITTTGLGEMGFGLPGAIGAHYATGKRVICLNTDGGIMMNLQELQTASTLPIKIVVFNNDGYLMIKHTQNAMFAGRKTAVDATSGVSIPSFAALARAFGYGYSIAYPDQQYSYWPRLLMGDGPCIIEVKMDPEQPLVPKLAAIKHEDGTITSPPLHQLSPLVQPPEPFESWIVRSA